MASKCNYYFEIQDTEKIFGGVYYESTPLTEYQAYSKAIKMGRDFLRNCPDADRYSVYLTTADDEDETVFMVSVHRNGRALDARVWDCRIEKHVYDSGMARINKLFNELDSDLRSLRAGLN